MKFHNTYILIPLIFACHSLSGQIDSTKLFEKSKGTWQFPIPQFINVSDCTIKASKSLINPKKSIVFITDSSYAVAAVHDGWIVGISELNGYYLTITKFGNYYLTYTGMQQPKLKVGEYVERGQTISYLMKSNGADTYELEIYLDTKQEEIFPCDWFTK